MPTRFRGCPRTRHQRPQHFRDTTARTRSHGISHTACARRAARVSLDRAGGVEADETFTCGFKKNKYASKKLRTSRGGVGKMGVAGARHRETSETPAHLTPGKEHDHAILRPRSSPTMRRRIATSTTSTPRTTTELASISAKTTRPPTRYFILETNIGNFPYGHSGLISSQISTTLKCIILSPPI